MRLYILRALVQKELHRHLANRGGLALLLLLVAAAVLLSVFNPNAAGGTDGGGTGMVGGVHHCYIEYANDSPLIAHLKASVPPELKAQVIFHNWGSGGPTRLVNAQPGVGAIQIRIDRASVDREKMAFQVWHPPGDPLALAPYEAWFWRETRVALGKQAGENLRTAGGNPSALGAANYAADDLWAVRESFRQLDLAVNAERLKLAQPGSVPLPPEIAIDRRGLGGKVLDLRAAIATGMVVFALYFSCVYLLPTLNCEERERGVLLAQALSPASPLEILTAKFLFYPAMGIGLAAVLAGIYKPAVLSSLFFWLSLTAVAAGFLGIGMTVATLAKTQRAAFLGAMCYLLSVSLILFICSANNIPYVSYLAVEYHGPRILHAALSGEYTSDLWLNLGAALGLGIVWITLAGWLFRRRGWQ